MQPQDIQLRLDRAQQGLRARGLDALLVTPGPDLRYLVGYDAVPLERLTCLVIPAQGQIRMGEPTSRSTPGASLTIPSRLQPDWWALSLALPSMTVCGRRRF